MSKSNYSENATLDALLRAVDPAFRSNASRYIALYTADPGETGTAITNEATYTGYARVEVTAATGFTAASGGESENVAQIQFDECTAGSNVITHLAIVTTTSGAGEIIYSGALTSSRTISAGITPLIAAGGLTVTED